ncbi:unnamed protein product [Gongylonema pulchrum]|uniref:DUF2345 domain-containing protein n=1 Tax=Gongylonema pulchrum TaxID=637853 RepID=A0A183DRR2_9BILA|nr:unnamed protein product [Gongylonema pulchrum]
MGTPFEFSTELLQISEIGIFIELDATEISIKSGAGIFIEANGGMLIGTDTDTIFTGIDAAAAAVLIDVDAEVSTEVGGDSIFIGAGADILIEAGPGMLIGASACASIGGRAAPDKSEMENGMADVDMLTGTEHKMLDAANSGILCEEADDVVKFITEVIEHDGNDVSTGNNEFVA